MVLHSSGVHGVEGYAGSAIQLNFLQSLLEKVMGDSWVYWVIYCWDLNTQDSVSEVLSDDFAILVIHVVNPYGMSWWRRWNENNVDLNRNLIDGMRPVFLLAHQKMLNEM